ncbi:MAG: glycosyltransferase family 4 protein [Clostridia bacterium]|nr:glycosyltransferase family 4 protein [Clostridia bacterium]
MSERKFILISPKNRTVYNFRGDLIKEIIAKGYEVVVTGPDKTDVDKIEALGARFVEIPMNKTGTSVVGDLKYCHALTKLLKTEKPDATLGYTVKPCVYGAIAAKRAKVKSINSLVTGGGYTFTATSFKARVLGLIVRTLYRYGFSKADHVIFQNSDDLNEFTEKGLVNREKCSFVNGSGVNMNQFELAPLPETITFFMLSRLLKSKGVQEYLEAAKQVKQQHPKVRFCLLGKYEMAMQDALDKEYVESFIRDGVIERFEETSDVRPYYAMCSVYVLPSYREGTPRTVLEAMAMGRPIITTDTQGCRETVKDGINGFLVPIKDSESVADKMDWFIENPERITQMGSASRDYCAEKFDVNKVDADMIRIMKL